MLGGFVTRIVVFVNIDILSQLDQATCDYVLQTWQMRGDRIDFFEKPSPDPISALAARYYIEQGSGRQVSSSVVIPVLENGLVSHLLLVLYETPQRFQETAQRMYYTMRDQFSLILRNIELLQTSRQSSERLEQQLRILQLLNTLATQLNVDSNRLAVIAAEEGAVLALQGCAEDARCLGAAVLTPSGQAALTQYMPAFGSRELWVAVSEEDNASVLAAEAVRQSAAGTVTVQSLREAGRGTQILFTQPAVDAMLVNWLLGLLS